MISLLNSCPTLGMISLSLRYTYQLLHSYTDPTLGMILVLQGFTGSISLLHRYTDPTIGMISPLLSNTDPTPGMIDIPNIWYH